MKRFILKYFYTFVVTTIKYYKQGQVTKSPPIGTLNLPMPYNAGLMAFFRSNFLNVSLSNNEMKIFQTDSPFLYISINIVFMHKTLPVKMCKTIFSKTFLQ